MDAASISAIASGAAQLLTGGTSAVAQGKLNRKTRKFNREEAEKQRNWSERLYNEQNAWNYEMWQQQNEYNSPLNQIERLKAAGLNPLYYGLDGSSAGEVTAAQPLAYERASIDNMPNPVASGMAAAAQVAQISNLQANTAKTGQETLTEVQKREQMQAEILKTKQELSNLVAQEGLTNAEREQIEKNISWLDRLNEATINMRESETALNQSQKKRIDELLEGEKIIQSKTAQDFDEKWKKIHAEIQKIAADTDIAVRDLEDYALNHASNGFMGTGLSLTNLFRAAKPRKRGKKHEMQEGSGEQRAYESLMNGVAD